ncbi:hypothetical protein [Bradyrhizobium genosp. A]|uniref:hypothetical protein n=1 Tax=Bradyrhizobium genosp. A TaxID=83626 RepID=UPI003CF0069D
MTIAIRALSASDKSTMLLDCIRHFREGSDAKDIFRFSVDDLKAIPGTPFAYWLPPGIIKAFKQLPPFESDGRIARAGMQTSNDFRFVRAWWEPVRSNDGWPPFAKGGRYSPFFTDLGLVVNWKKDGIELKAFNGALYGGGHWSRNLRNVELYGRAGFTYPRRLSKLSVSPLPRGSVISIRGSGIYGPEGDLLAMGGLLSSSPFDYLTKSMLGRFAHPQFDNSVLSKVPVPVDFLGTSQELAEVMKESILLGRRRFEDKETSHQFLLPISLLPRIPSRGSFPQDSDFEQLQAKIDEIAFRLYGLQKDRALILKTKEEEASFVSDDDDDHEEIEENEGDEDSEETAQDRIASVLSWCVGVAVGRFDLRLATGERDAPPEPDPFDPLPTKSPGMLLDNAERYHAHSGILVDDQGHPHDLVQLIEDILRRAKLEITTDVRRWLKREFFPAHLKQYSLSGRKAPIYWPLSTASGAYTLWLYYPSLTSQTLYSAVNDFLEGPNGKLKQVEQEAVALRNKGNARSRDEDRKLEALQLLQSELIELRDTLLQIAPSYRPSHDDGVQITAAPLWPLFRHRPWQKLLKETWTKLENGDYDWAHLAFGYWPERVREKCKTDKSLAIAHDLELFYVEPSPKPAKSRGKKGAGA